MRLIELGEEEGEVATMSKLPYSFLLDDYGPIKESDDRPVPLYTTVAAGSGLDNTISEFIDPKKFSNAMKR